MSDVRVDHIVDDRPDDGLFRVNRTTFTSEHLFATEHETLFTSCWLYLGHESEVPNAGNFQRRTVGGRPLFFVRQTDGSVRAFFNSCTHRGATVCREPSGTARFFQCFYHAWTFDRSGELLRMPGENVYTGCWDKSSLALHSPAGLDQYRGLYFVTFDQDAPRLGEYLGAARGYIDLILDQAEGFPGGGGWRVLRGTNRYTIHGNWKLLVENSMDAYHAPATHQTYFEYMSGYEQTPRQDRPDRGPRDLGGGHTVSEGQSPYGRPVARWSGIFGDDAREDLARIRGRLVNAFGEERAYRMADSIRLLLIFPNLLLHDITAVTARFVEPVSPGEMAVSAWALGPAAEDAAQVQRRIISYVDFIGPGGFATPDDVEVIESCQRGFAAREVAWSDLSRGVGLPAKRDHEFTMRTFWREWRRRVVGPGGPETPDVERLPP